MMVNGLLIASIVSAIVPKSAVSFEYVFRQERDASCGYAVVASLLAIYFDVPTSEAKLVEAFPPESGTGKIAFSAMVPMLSCFDIDSRGFAMSLVDLEKALDSSSPLIVHFGSGEGHFALLLASVSDGLVVADPAAGLSVVSREEFRSRWSGSVLAVHSTKGDPGAVCLDAARFASDRKQSLEAAFGDLRW
jgi:predicted double-glycine peptidase